MREFLAVGARPEAAGDDCALAVRPWQTVAVGLGKSPAASIG